MTPGCSLFSESSVLLTGSDEIYEKFNMKNVVSPQAYTYLKYSCTCTCVYEFGYVRCECILTLFSHWVHYKCIQGCKFMQIPPTPFLDHCTSLTRLDSTIFCQSVPFLFVTTINRSHTLYTVSGRASRSVRQPEKEHQQCSTSNPPWMTSSVSMCHSERHMYQ